MIWKELVNLREDLGKYDCQPISVLINALSQAVRRAELMQGAPPQATAPVQSASRAPAPGQRQTPASSPECSLQGDSADQWGARLSSGPPSWSQDFSVTYGGAPL